MSITVDFAFNAAGNLSDIAKRASSAVGVRLRACADDPAERFGRLLGIEVTLRTTEGYVDDRELDFTRHGFLLSTRTPVPDGALRLYQIERTALAALSLLLRAGATSGILAFDMQTLLARYRAEGESVRDLLSDTVVCLPGHLVDLSRHAPNYAM